ncbi:MAG: hypothetical protein HYV39_02285 [Candidatus Levybacteria bacterium]|nr:hypothetical protein [Candidatus Levybacteria bacterium]
MKKIQQTLQSSIEQETLFRNWEKYRGSIVMVVGNEVFSTKRAKNVDKMLMEIEDKYHKQPLITYIPKEGTLIL